jgi:uncharacterized protein
MSIAFDDPKIVELVRAIKGQYVLDWEGIHGISHWARVWENGMRVVAETGADKRIVGYFALFHDARRFNEGRDPDHGRRGADLATQWRGDLFDLEDKAFAALCYACVHHTDGCTEGEVSVQACWDADRLDLLRVGIRPAANRLCTDAARTCMVWANERARGITFDESMRQVWLRV